jgi:hypothetical protein
MPVHVQFALSDFMDAVVIVDPTEYQRRPGEPDRPLRTLPFGQAGLVTFLVAGGRRRGRSFRGSLGGRMALVTASGGLSLLAAAS